MKKHRILEAIGPLGDGARMPRNRTVVDATARLPTLGRPSLEAANERPKRLGQRRFHEDDKMYMVGHQLGFYKLDLRVKTRHFGKRIERGLAERGGFDAWPRTAKHRTGLRSANRRAKAKHRTGLRRAKQRTKAKHRTGLRSANRRAKAKHRTGLRSANRRAKAKHRTGLRRASRRTKAKRRTGLRRAKQRTKAKHRTGLRRASRRTKAKRRTERGGGVV